MTNKEIYFQDELLDFIELIQRAVPNAIEVFTKGNCGSFALILAKAFPGGEIKDLKGHIIYEIDKQWYDITGIVSNENIEYTDAVEIFSKYGVGKAMIYLRNNYEN